MAAPSTSDPDLEQVAWDLSHLLDGSAERHDGSPAEAVDATLASTRERSEAFAQRYRDRLGSLDAHGLAEAMHELEGIEDAIGRVYSYAALSFATNTADPARGALLQRVQEQVTGISTLLVFWELEWAALEDDQVDALLASDELDFCRHHLRAARRYRPHLLTE